MLNFFLIIFGFIENEVILYGGGFTKPFPDPFMYFNVISVNLNLNCAPIPIFPQTIVGAVATTAYEKSDYAGPIVCGGAQLNEPSNKCWALYNDVVNYTSGSENNLSWLEASPMRNARVNAASVQVLEAGKSKDRYRLMF